MKIIFLHNYPQLYRLPIWRLLNSNPNYEIKFYFDVHNNFSTEEISEVILEKEFNVKRIRNIRIGNKIIWQRGIINDLLYKEYDLCIMLANSWTFSIWISAIIARIRNKKVVFWTHGLYGKESVLARVFKNGYYSLASHVLVYSDYSRELMISKGYKPNRITTIYNSLDYETQVKIRESISNQELNDFKEALFSNSNPVVIYVGRLIKSKKVELFVEAINQLSLQKFHVNAIIVGDGPEKDSLITVANKFKTNIIFYGKSYSELELCKLFCISDLVISPGNVGLLAIHSLTYGTPVITHDKKQFQMPEFEAIENGVTGLFFEFNSVTDLVKKIKYWLTNKKKSEISAYCSKTVDSKFNPRAQYQIITNLIAQLSRNN
jgi:glycosyltransferase involved in cell wall biosynthesis